MTVVKLVKGLQSGTLDWAKSSQHLPCDTFPFRGWDRAYCAFEVKGYRMHLPCTNLPCWPRGSDACYEPRLASFFVGEMWQVRRFATAADKTSRNHEDKLKAFESNHVSILWSRHVASTKITLLPDDICRAKAPLTLCTSEAVKAQLTYWERCRRYKFPT